MNVIIAQSWKAFEWWCRKNGADQRDRNQVIPLIQASDRYRLYGRNLSGWAVVTVGAIDNHNMTVFVETLKKQGVNI